MIRALLPALPALLLLACGPAESAPDNNPEASEPVDSNNAVPAGVIELLPDGYERVTAGRFSPDGTRLAMLATPTDEGAKDQLITTDLDGGDVEVLVDEGLSYLTTVAWMPNGESLLYGGGGGIMRVARDGSEPTLVVDTFAVEGLDVSVDGSLVAWSVNGGNTVTTAAVGADPFGREDHIAGPEGQMPRFGPTGRIAFATPEGIAISEPDGTELQSFDASTNFFSNVAWQDPASVVVVTNHGLTAVDLLSGDLTDLHEQHAAIGADVSPDGERFVLGVNGQPPLYLGPL